MNYVLAFTDCLWKEFLIFMYCDLLTKKYLLNLKHRLILVALRYCSFFLANRTDTNKSTRQFINNWTWRKGFHNWWLFKWCLSERNTRAFMCLCCVSALWFMQLENTNPATKNCQRRASIYPCWWFFLCLNLFCLWKLIISNKKITYCAHTHPLVCLFKDLCINGRNTP